MDITAQAAATVLPGQRLVPGRVELVTESPLLLPSPDGIQQRLDELVHERPWLMPSLLLMVIAALLVRRR